MEPKNGQFFTAKIKGTAVSGRITLENGKTYLCQNQFEGSSCSNKHEFVYSWYMDHNVSDFKISTRPLKVPFAPLKQYGDWNLTRNTKEVIFGCGEVRIDIADLIGMSKIVKSKTFMKAYESVGSLDTTVVNIMANPARTKNFVSFMTKYPAEIALISKIKYKIGSRKSIKQIMTTTPEIYLGIAGRKK